MNWLLIFVWAISFTTLMLVLGIAKKNNVRIKDFPVGLKTFTIIIICYNLFTLALLIKDIICLN